MGMHTQVNMAGFKAFDHHGREMSAERSMQQHLTDSSAYAAVHTEIVLLLDAARLTAARSVNAVMAATYWQVGRRIVALEQGGQDRAAYGQALIERLSADLTQRFVMRVFANNFRLLDIKTG